MTIGKLFYTILLLWLSDLYDKDNKSCNNYFHYRANYNFIMNSLVCSSGPTTTTNASSNSDDGLSIGTKAGLAVGCAIFVLLALRVLISFVILPRYKKRKAEAAVVYDTSRDAEQVPKELNELAGQ
jgi:hypothetical protein